MYFQNAAPRNYFAQRIQEAGMTPETAEQYGIFPAPDGGIIIQPRHLVDTLAGRWQAMKGSTVYWQKLKDGKRVPHQLKRVHPDTLEQARKQGRDLPKYMSDAKEDSGISMPLFPGVNALKARPGGTRGLTEGPFKAFALDHCGVPTIGVNGNIMRLTEPLEIYLIENRPDDFFILIDGDYKDIKATKDGGIYTTQRPEQFALTSALTFARQLLEFKEIHGLDFKIHLVAVRPDAPGKGIDDLLNAVPDKTAVLAEFRTFKSGQYFNATTLVKSRYKEQVKDFFHLRGYANFYAAHRDVIQDAPFRFLGVTYRYRPNERAGTSGDLFGPGGYFECMSNPLAIDLEQTAVQVEKYLSEAAPTIATLLNKHKRIAIQAPTGSGKTRFTIKELATSGRKIIIALPYKMQVEQLKGTRGVVAVHGSPTIATLEAALNAQVVVCTYDQAHRFADQGRTLVIDEAHNLIRQHGTNDAPFRADTLARLIEAIERAPAAVLLSGTMPAHLVHALNFHLVNVRAKEVTKVRVHIEEATKDTKKAIRAKVLALLEAHDFERDGRAIVLCNDKEELERIREYLVESGKLKAHEIDTITRAEVEAGNRETFDTITRKSLVPEHIKLVLATCLLSEGVNIYSKDVKTLYHVGRDHTQAVQFAARPRKAPHIDLVCILPPERDALEGLTINAARELERLTRRAEAMRPFWEQERAEQRADLLAEYPEYAEYIDDITDDVNANAKEPQYSHLRLNSAGVPVVDTLAILADIEHKVSRAANNAYFVTQLLRFDGFELAGQTSDDVPAHITEQVEALEAVRAEDEAIALELVTSELKTNTAGVVGALVDHYRQTNRHKAPAVEALTVEGEAGSDAAQVFALTEGGQALKRYRAVRAAVQDFLELRQTGAPPEHVHSALEAWSASQRKDFIFSWHKCSRIEAYQVRRQRIHLATADRAAAKIELAIIKSIQEAAQANRSMSKEDIFQAATKSLRVGRYCEKSGIVISELLPRITPASTLRLVQSFFEVQAKNHIGEKRYTIGERITTTKLLEQLEACSFCTSDVCSFCNENSVHRPENGQSSTSAKITNPLKRM
jgi:late competence protein required for DNA uptake (superfamily II DNA/RNA helicase)